MNTQVESIGVAGAGLCVALFPSPLLQSPPRFSPMPESKRVEITLTRSVDALQSFLVDRVTPIGQLERFGKMRQFLASRVTSGAISETSKANALAVIVQAIASAGRALPVPDVATGDDDDVMLIWRKGPHYMEVEISANSNVEIFYRDKNSAQLWEATGGMEQISSPETLVRLSQFK